MISVNRRGITRTVILTRRWAIKVPTIRGLGRDDKGARIASFCRGVLANRSEQEWSGVKGLNPVVWSFRGLINIYRRTAPVQFEMPEEMYALITDDFVPIGDRKSDNIGWLGVELVWIDYDYSWNGIKASGGHRSE